MSVLISALVAVFMSQPAQAGTLFLDDMAPAEEQAEAPVEQAPAAAPIKTQTVAPQAAAAKKEFLCSQGKYASNASDAEKLLIDTFGVTSPFQKMLVEQVEKNGGMFGSTPTPSKIFIQKSNSGELFLNIVKGGSYPLPASVCKDGNRLLVKLNTSGIAVVGTLMKEAVVKMSVKGSTVSLAPVSKIPGFGPGTYTWAKAVR